MKKLYTAFKGKYNSSRCLVEKLDGEKLFLTNSFDGLKRDIDGIENNCNAVYMFGLDKGLTDSIRVEPCAEKDGETIHTEFDTAEIIDKLKKEGLKCKLAENPTHYLCNEAYYYMLKKVCRRALFIHIPPLKYFSNEMAEAILKTIQ
ncbi:MAG: hypothetical protein IJC04_09370 [Oscillospiraceae bacterium]|nr:hypothetical protein [Oscillospiraceae bacterium]